MLRRHKLKSLPIFNSLALDRQKLLGKTLILALGMCMTLPAFAGGPWLLPKRQGFFQFQSILPVYQYNSLLMGNFINETQALNRKVFNADYSFYLEYGITDNLNVIATLPFKHVSTGDLTDEQAFDDLLPAGELLGLSNPRVALKYGLLAKSINISVSLQTSWNTISRELEKGLATGIAANSFGLMAHIGRSKEKHYGFLEVGYHKYTNDFSDILEVNLEHGWKLGQRWNMAFVLNVRQSLENGPYRNLNLEQTGLYPNDQEWAVISGKIAYETANGFGINASIPLVPIKFKHVGYNGTVCLGVYKKF